MDYLFLLFYFKIVIQTVLTKSLNFKYGVDIIQ